jgi:hypothetical protein
MPKKTIKNFSALSTAELLRSSLSQAVKTRCCVDSLDEDVDVTVVAALMQN